jgi:hypothetical protein
MAARAWGTAQSASMPSLSSGCFGIASISSFGEALAMYGDGSLAYWTTSDKTAGLVEQPLGRAAPPLAARGVHHFTACGSDRGAFFAVVSGSGGELTVGHARRDGGGGGGGGGGAWAGLADVVQEIPVPSSGVVAGATCAHISAATATSEFVVYGTAAGVVRRFNLRDRAEAARAIAAGSGPCVHAVSTLTYSPDVVMAARCVGLPCAGVLLDGTHRRPHLPHPTLPSPQRPRHPLAGL